MTDEAPSQRSLSGNQIGGRRSPAVGSPEKSTTGKIDPGMSPPLYLTTPQDES
jgi:hypothetical protein